ncbi:helix-turn-helix domain-containing protein [Mannheimia indoligenes]|uniref:helix-turn-helix domain-containing protein n=1 Tax=Mannheimia indoligenes TaxID=3103145 RepID=UPI002FE6B6F1
MYGTNINPNEKTSQSQNAKILAHLKNGGRITSLSALKNFGCLRLSARIKDLRDRGYDIQSETITLSNGKRVSQYFMEYVK